MAGKFCVSLTCAKDNPDKATVAFVVANAALGSEKDTMIFLSTEGVRLSQRGYGEDIHEEGFAPEDSWATSSRGREDLRLLPVLQAPDARRNETGGWGGHRGRGEAGGIPRKRGALRHLLIALREGPA
jgi:hypothetical protein